ncbi:MAG: hypothetical protein IID30_14040 [Planctomycetes bacterium]|nr:hypothetical protein [Planctomycetota bacterium]
MKRLRVILLFLLLGAIVNVAVAWGIASILTIEDTMSNDETIGMSVVEYETWNLSRYEAFGTQIFMSTRFKVHNEEEELLELTELWSEHPIENVKPSWGSMDVATELYRTLPGPPEHTMVQEIQMYEARGWPMHSLWCLRILLVHDGTGNNQNQASGFIAIPILFFEDLEPLVLPLYPIWTGFALNTIFYASLLWLIIPGPFVLRRFIRKRRGLCLKCGYDLRGVDHQACPECGEGIRKGNPA